MNTCEQVITDCNDGLMPPFTAHCSKCGDEWGFTPRYCPNCGAKVTGTRDKRTGPCTSPTRYEALFGTPEKMAAYIVENCHFDCPACPMPPNCPGREDCGMWYDQENIDKVLAWLNEKE